MVHGHSVAQEFPFLLWNPKVHCRVHESPPLHRILSKCNPFRTPTSCLYHKIILASTPPYPMWSFYPSDYSTKRLCSFVTCRMLSHTHTHTHTHSLSLSLSLCQSVTHSTVKSLQRNCDPRVVNKFLTFVESPVPCSQMPSIGACL
jgi:hypothetical protein